jgi:hypothetical protein
MTLTQPFVRGFMHSGRPLLGLQFLQTLLTTLAAAPAAASASHRSQPGGSHPFADICKLSDQKPIFAIRRRRRRRPFSQADKATLCAEFAAVLLVFSPPPLLDLIE